MFKYNAPDKYEKYIGIHNVKREWVYKGDGVFYHKRNYNLALLEKIYEYGYRAKDFRGETIDEAFKRIMAIPNNENQARMNWLEGVIGDRKSLLDIGSGLGVFPALWKETISNNIYCVETNKESICFINSLGIKCFNNYPPKNQKFDVVSLVHVLEHFLKPIGVLWRTKKYIKKGGLLFVELPDAVGFEHLDKNHDDFNSCHVWLWKLSAVCKMIDSIPGLKISDVHRQYYPERNLQRILVIAHAT